MIHHRQCPICFFSSYRHVVLCSVWAWGGCNFIRKDSAAELYLDHGRSARTTNFVQIRMLFVLIVSWLIELGTLVFLDDIFSRQGFARFCNVSACVTCGQRRCALN